MRSTDTSNTMPETPETLCWGTQTAGQCAPIPEAQPAAARARLVLDAEHHGAPAAAIVRHGRCGGGVRAGSSRLLRLRSRLRVRRVSARGRQRDAQLRVGLALQRPLVLEERVLRDGRRGAAAIGAWREQQPDVSRLLETKENCEQPWAGLALRSALNGPLSTAQILGVLCNACHSSCAASPSQRQRPTTVSWPLFLNCVSPPRLATWLRSRFSTRDITTSKVHSRKAHRAAPNLAGLPRPQAAGRSSPRHRRRSHGAPPAGEHADLATYNALVSVASQENPKDTNLRHAQALHSTSTSSPAVVAEAGHDTFSSACLQAAAGQ